MKKLSRLFVLTLLFFLNLTITLSAQVLPQSIVVIFGDGEKVEVSNWTFVYKYGDSDHLFSPGSISYYEQTKKTQDLLIDVGEKTVRGVTIREERSIPPEKLSTIKFGTRTTFLGNVSNNITITLVDGEVIKVDALKPAKGLISKAGRVFNTDLYFEGRAQLGTKVGEFSKCLYFREYGLPDLEPKENVSELRFHSR